MLMNLICIFRAVSLLNLTLNLAQKSLPFKLFGKYYQLRRKELSNCDFTAIRCKRCKRIKFMWKNSSLVCTCARACMRYWRPAFRARAVGVIGFISVYAHSWAHCSINYAIVAWGPEFRNTVARSVKSLTSQIDGRSQTCCSRRILAVSGIVSWPHACRVSF